jgi:putative phage-type endonuclease
MKRLISTLNLSKEDWLHYRKCGITGTDAGAILGVNPYRSAFQVYCDKNGETIENIDNEAMRQGRDLEDYVAQRFTEATGLKVRRANAIYQSEEHPLLLADFDRLIVGQKAGLECKTVSPFSADKWADGKIPAHYMAQVNHYLAVSGFDCWYIAALIFGKELVIHKITTDKEVLNNLIAKEEHFWKYNVMPEIPPVPTGSEGDTQQINQLYSADDRNKTADLNPIRNLLDKRQELSDQIEQLEQEKASIEQQVKLEMQ